MPTEVMFVLPSATGVGPTVLECLTPLPEEDIWLAKQKSQRTRTAYQKDVEQFIRSTGITSRHELRRADYRAVIAWERAMREAEFAAPSTVRRRLAALSSLFKRLIRHGYVTNNPVADIERPAINRDEGSTLAFSTARARKILDLPLESAIEGLRDRAILSVGLQVGLRHAE